MTGPDPFWVFILGLTLGWTLARIYDGRWLRWTGTQEDQVARPTRLEDAATPGSRISDKGGEETLVAALGEAQRRKLAKNRGKLHWADPEVTDAYLLQRLREEVKELALALRFDDEDPWAEAADVANFAAMLADRKAPVRATQEVGTDAQVARIAAALPEAIAGDDVTIRLGKDPGDPYRTFLARRLYAAGLRAPDSGVESPLTCDHSAGWLRRSLDDTTWCEGCGRWRDDIMREKGYPPLLDSRVDIAEGRRLLAAASPGPWYVPERYSWVFRGSNDMVAECVLKRDALLIAWLRNNAEALLAGTPDLDVAVLGKALDEHRISYWATEPCEARCALNIAAEYARLREAPDGR